MSKFTLFITTVIWLTVVSIVSAKSSVYEPQPYVKLNHPEWSKNATIYQLNTRQFTKEGTFRAAQKQLPRIKALGVDILWLMPIHPIGEKNRKGSLGSPYSVRDYKGVNQEFGDLEDFKSFVRTAHELDMHVILDWVANHTAWDHPWVESNPEFYERDYKGDFRPTPWWDWSDIINVDNSHPGLREAMAKALRYWVEEADIDGYRCDVAGFVDIDFWEQIRRELDAIKPVFMLAEWESRDLHEKAFDMTYAWSWYEAAHQIAKRKKDVSALFVYYSWNECAYPKDAMRMTFVSNHDKNSWEGTQFEAFGEALEATIVLSVVGEGMPLIYNGQEAGNTKRLEFFEKDPIAWKTHEIGALYQKLFALMKSKTALWHATWGATMVHVPNSAPKEVLSFVRKNQDGGVFTVINFSTQPQKVHFQDPGLWEGTYETFGSGEQINLPSDFEMEIEPWGYEVFVQ